MFVVTSTPAADNKLDLVKPEGAEELCNVKVSESTSKSVITTSPSIATGESLVNLISYTNASGEEVAATVPLERSVPPAFAADESFAEPSSAETEIVDKSPSRIPARVIDELALELFGEK